MPEPGGSSWEEDGPPGSTPLEVDELDGLLPTWVATRADLNEVEQQNILSALSRRRWQRATAAQLLDDLSVRDLHKDMFGRVWRWAGRYRATERNIGVDPRAIAVGVHDLMEDAKLWFADEAIQLDEAACRFHHQLVQIHAFPNGNGRHARAMTDLILRAHGGASFTWGRGRLDASGAVRSAYISALRSADGGDYGPLAEFVRSC